MKQVWQLLGHPTGTVIDNSRAIYERPVNKDAAYGRDRVIAPSIFPPFRSSTLFIFYLNNDQIAKLDD